MRPRPPLLRRQRNQGRLIPPERPTPNIAPSWNVAPNDPLPVLRYDTKDRQRSLEVMRWGLVLFWAKGIKVGFANITPGPKKLTPSRPSARRSGSAAAWSRRKFL